MQFSLYINISENNRLDKRLTTEVAYSGSLLDESSVINPVFLIAAVDLSEYNYLYCMEFNRYYYIDDIVSVRNGLWRVSCRVDVLMSYKSYIRKVKAIIASQESFSVGNSFLDDGTFVADNRVSTNVINFPAGFSSSGVYVLTTIGPGGTQVN